MAADDEDPEFEQEVGKQMRVRKIRNEADRRLRDEQAGDDRFVLPKSGRTLADDLKHPPRERPYTIDKLHTRGGNTLLVAQYKAGKTTLEINLMKALADRQPFLGRFEVAELSGRVGFLNFEMNADQFRDWVREAGVEHPTRIAEPLHLRGYSLPFWEPEIADELVAWLAASEVEFLIVDPASQAWRVLVESENDNTQIDQFTHALDGLKRESGVTDLLISHHMGRQRFAEGEERGRGATRLEDWMDHGWYLTKDRSSGSRAIHALGRDVEVEAIDLKYDAGTRAVTCTGETRQQRREDEGIERVVQALAGFSEPPSTGELEDTVIGNKNKRNGWIRTAEDRGFIVRKTFSGRHHCELTDEGRQLLERRVSVSRADS